MTGEVRPLLRVVRGNASAEETAALVAGLALARAARRAAVAQRAAAQHCRDSAALANWCDRARLLGRPVAPGPGAWRASGLPS